MHSCVHILRDYSAHLDRLNDVDFRHSLTEAISAFANAFSLITGTHCRACIKVLEVRGISNKAFHDLPTAEERANNLMVQTFCRDSITANLESDDDKRVHHITDNTDFYELYKNPDKRNYFSNNLKKEDGYQNTSMQHGKTLPYKSTIVWPIRRLVAAQDQFCNTENELLPLSKHHDIIGYLCIDSTRQGVFRKDYDVEVGSQIADILFMYIKKYHDHKYIKVEAKNGEK